MIGNVGLSFLRMQSMGKFVKQIYEMYPKAKYTGIYDLPKPIVMLRDIALTKSIVLKRFRYLSNII